MARGAASGRRLTPAAHRALTGLSLLCFGVPLLLFVLVLPQFDHAQPFVQLLALAGCLLATLVSGRAVAGLNMRLRS
ncbi:MAG: hypothetical protein AAGI15_16745 [Pseudomonadota bacterium]